MKVNKNTCVIEMTPPRRDSKTLDEGLKKFAQRFERVMESGFVASLSDNVMGIPHPQPVELIKELKLNPRKNQVIVHINTFHTKAELAETLSFCKEKGITNFLCLTGDGSPDLPKLSPEYCSVNLVKYIKSQHPEFTCGVAFNPYNPPEEEMNKMRRKVEAGADFVITQPILEENQQLNKLMAEFPDLPVIVECWFSKKLELLFDIIGREMPENFQYDGFEKLLELRKIYPESGNCMSTIGFNKTYPKVEAYWNNER